MGSVQSTEMCPRCNTESANEDYYYKTGEIYIFCHRCGYSFDLSLIRDDDGHAKKNREGKWIYTHSTTRPIGMIILSAGKGWTYTQVLDKKQLLADLTGIPQWMETNPVTVAVLVRYSPKRYSAYNFITKERTKDYEQTCKWIYGDRSAELPDLCEEQIASQ